MAEIAKKASFKNPAFWVCLIASIILLTAGFLTPPMAKIDGSVLSGVGELLGFSTIEVFVIAMKKGLDAKLTHGKTSVVVGDIVENTNNKNEIEDESMLEE